IAEFGGDEELVAWNAGLGYGASDAFLVVVALGSVDQPIAGAEGGGDSRMGFDIGHLPYAEAELGNGIAVVERNLGDVGHGVSGLVKGSVEGQLAADGRC